MQTGPETLLAATLSVGALFADRVADAAGRPALQDPDRVLSYGQLGARVWRVANLFAGLGLARGDRIALISENCADYVVTLLAAARLGVIVACQNWRQSEEELAHCVALAAPALLLSSAAFAARAEAVACDGHPRRLSFGPDFDALAARAGDAPPPDAAQPEDILSIVYTSGTTGLPKGAAISHRAMVARAMVNAIDTPVGRDDAFVAWTPLFHMGAADLTFGTLIAGGKVIVMPGFDAGRLAELIRDEPIGDLTVVPGVIDRLIAALRERRIRPRGVRMCGAMADLVPPRQMAELTTLLAAPYRNTFGSTETGAPPASRGMIAPGVAPESLSKTQSSFCRVRLVDEAGADVPLGQPGEMAMRGPTLFSGYWNAGSLDRDGFRGGWFHGGDILRRNADGTLDFVDRRKYLIKSGGENIYPAEIERVILALPGVRDAVVVRKPDETWGEVPVAFVVAADPALTPERIADACRRRIAGYKIPRHVFIVGESEIVRGVTGKVARHLLESRLLERERHG